MKPYLMSVAGIALAAALYAFAPYAGHADRSGGIELSRFAISAAHAQNHSHSHGHSHDHGEAATAEPLTGRFGEHGDRHPQTKRFKTAADGLAERRRRSMSALSGHFRAISATLLSDAGGEEMIQTHADALALLGGQIDKLFDSVSPAPEGERGALPGIWEKPELFAEYTEAFSTETARFARTVREGGDMVNGLHDLRYYCVACHAEFRQR